MLNTNLRINPPKSKGGGGIYPPQALCAYPWGMDHL